MVYMLGSGKHAKEEKRMSLFKSYLKKLSKNYLVHQGGCVQPYCRICSKFSGNESSDLRGLR